MKRDDKQTTELEPEQVLEEKPDLLAAALEDYRTPIASFVPGELTRVGPFVIMDQLAEGATADIYRARYQPGEGERQEFSLQPNDVVVIKLLRNLAGGSSNDWDRVNTEAELLLLLDHPALVRSITRGMSHGRIWMALEYIEGETLSLVVDAFSRANMRMKPDLAICLAADVCAGLAALHGLVDARSQNLGLVHRDISPRNILLDLDGRARLIDFGNVWRPTHVVAKPSIVGTPGYLSPEQARGETLTQASDVYVLGLLLFEWLTSRPAYDVASLPDSTILAMHGQGVREDWPEDVVVPEPLRDLIETALLLDPGARPADAAEFYHRLAPMLPKGDSARRALRLVARDLLRSNAERPPPLFV